MPSWSSEAAFEGEVCGGQFASSYVGDELVPVAAVTLFAFGFPAAFRTLHHRAHDDTSAAAATAASTS